MSKITRFNMEKKILIEAKLKQKLIANILVTLRDCPGCSGIMRPLEIAKKGNLNAVTVRHKLTN